MSPNETGPQRETGKQRTGRIRLDYYKTIDPLSRGKGWLSVVAVVVVAAWVGGLGWDARPWSRRSERTLALVSPGPLAAAHATWDAECEACHVPFTPIDGSAWTARFVGRAGAGSDTHCQSCHNAAGHHEATTTGDAGSCASCHRDHRGRDASLVSLADQNCTRCHAALASHTRSGATAFAASVTRFDADPSHHPEVALFRAGRTPRDPGRVKFNHALHMTRGLTLTPRGVPLKTPADLAPEDRARYRDAGHKDTEGIQLRCASCHHPDNDRGTGPAPTFRAVRFETDCKACHPLDYDPDRPALRLAHPLQPAAVDEALWESFAAQYVRDHPELRAVRPAPRPIPGPSERPENRAARQAVQDKVEKAEKVVFGDKKCGECHSYQDAAGGREVATLTAWDPGKAVRVAPANVPAVWYKNAAFDHAAHTAIGCRSCHDRAYADAKDASTVSGDVILPAIGVCQSCHAPRQKTPTAVTGGAGFQCSECHRYHSDTGPAALARDDAAGADLKQFLLGTLKKSR